MFTKTLRGFMLNTAAHAKRVISDVLQNEEDNAVPKKRRIKAGTPFKHYLRGEQNLRFSGPGVPPRLATRFLHATKGWRNNLGRSPHPAMSAAFRDQPGKVQRLNAALRAGTCR